MQEHTSEAARKNPLLERLRSGTRELHDRIEGVVPLLRPDLTLTAYTAYLARIAGYYPPIEAALASAPPSFVEHFGIDERKKSHLLHRDLLALGLDEARLAALPVCSDLPDLSSPDRMIGCLYVLEGSTLGSRVLLRTVKNLGVDEGSGAAFLAGYGADTGPMWVRYGEALAAYASRADAALVVRGAEDTFTTLERWIATAEA
ncbi:biliverdin-producing heme oxygenase [Chondromyces apiculatus]|uniref:Bacteriophytochrome heme oxygenase BphO n=1 Tax=Chondromyces apiculatus DSM 436 TaxID=1192034 RepID=A0A017TI57_9BACT|nr:biliverdin-producing heme oxygenase [Chondromyces apiculatus]EYF08316.1 bacteriophytochrome heme oxygenase BphO [Chondromyces apiculatus DSM 436]